ncbi:unnamed protein product [Rotaria sp. Silwood1]|nr:unnamed protein product [Rotaria sp. Silwood1]CAF1393261.1 unnamed protein product [Rotaria sp. Silwood1]
MSKQYSYRREWVNINDCVGIAIHTVDRTNTDPKYLPCLIIEKNEKNNISLYKLICQYGILQNTFEAGQFMNLKDACPNELKQIDVSTLKPITIIEASKLYSRGSTTDRTCNCQGNNNKQQMKLFMKYFKYLNVYHIYKEFFYLNQRYKSLVVNRNFSIQINITTMSKLNFDIYHENMIQSNKYRMIYDYIQLETLIFDNIDTKYLNNILKYLIYLPKLYSLIFSLIDYIQDPNILFHHIFRLSKLKYFDNIHFNIFKKLIICFFGSVEVLHFTTHDLTYLVPNQWEELILFSMPNLRIFDIYHTSIIKNNQLIYLLLIYEFDSLFWTQRQYEFNSQLYLRIQENNSNSVKHVHICSKYLPNHSVIYFPNANELTIEHYFNTTDDSISTILNCILPLKQLTKLVIQSSHFSFKQIINLIRFTLNLHTLKLDLLSFNETNLNLSQQNEAFQYVSNIK